MHSTLKCKEVKMIGKLKILTTLIFVMLLIKVAFAGTGKLLTYKQVVNNKPKLTKSLPDIKGWVDDNSYFQMIEDTAKNIKKLYKVHCKNGKKDLYINPEDFSNCLPEEINFWKMSDKTDDYKKMIYVYQNDLYYLDTENKKFIRLTTNKEKENNPTLSPDGKQIAFTKKKDLYSLNIETGLEHRLTNDATDCIYNGWASWVYYEEILGRQSKYKAFYWSPDSKKLAFLQFNDSSVPIFPIYRAKGKHGYLEKEHYPGAGDPIPEVKLGIVSSIGKECVWADFGCTKNQYIAAVKWLPNNKLTCQWMNREQNELKLYEIDIEDGSKESLYEEKQNSWVSFIHDIHFLDDDKLLFSTDKIGFKHLYILNTDDGSEKKLTKGKWQIKSIEHVDEDNNIIYFIADKENSTERHLYKMKINGWRKKLVKLTNKKGCHRVVISPKGKYFIDTYSNINLPHKMALYNNSKSKIRELGNSKKPVMNEYDLGKVELFRVNVDEYELPVKWILPPNFDKNKKYPVIFRIYGGPNASSVSNTFPRSLNSFLLAQKGAIILSVDHRGSGHFGKKGVAKMYRKLGKWEMHDWIEIVKWLRKKSYVDTNKIAITGGSYGGYVTLMALTYGHEYFTHGISLYPVSRWELYDAVYTERYMDKPADNLDGYKFGSSLEHADKYEGKLLLIHGTMDDNVHIQNSTQIIEKFIDMNKQFDFMMYPGERHGIKNNEHLDKLVSDWLINNLLLE